jgi:hypothetical protein
MEKVYFVTLLVQEYENKYPYLTTDMIDDAESEAEALGIAVIKNEIGPCRNVVDYGVEDFIFNPSEDNRNFEHTIDLARETFLNLLDISSMTIMQKVHTLIVETNCENEGRLTNKIPAIKLLRDHVKPFIGLKSCKEIVELWIEQILVGCSKTSLSILVHERLAVK